VGYLAENSGEGPERDQYGMEIAATNMARKKLSESDPGRDAQRGEGREKKNDFILGQQHHLAVTTHHC
jgi:hypothetical protein